MTTRGATPLPCLYWPEGKCGSSSDERESAPWEESPVEKRQQSQDSALANAADCGCGSPSSPTAGASNVGALGILLEHKLRTVFAKPTAAGIFLFVNGLILLAGERLRRRDEVRSLATAGSGEPVASPVDGPSRRLDLELELGFVVGVPNQPGEAVAVDAFAEHVFGLVLVNDWNIPAYVLRLR